MTDTLKALNEYINKLTNEDIKIINTHIFYRIDNYKNQMFLSGQFYCKICKYSLYNIMYRSHNDFWEKRIDILSCNDVVIKNIIE